VDFVALKKTSEFLPVRGNTGRVFFPDECQFLIPSGKWNRNLPTLDRPFYTYDRAGCTPKQLAILTITGS
jgi:hypothetical protein